MKIEKFEKLYSKIIQTFKNEKKKTNNENGYWEKRF